MIRTKVSLPSWKLPDPAAALRAASKQLYRSATLIMADSKENFVPVETGTLRSSGIVDPPALEGGRVVISLGYGGPAAKYALAVHENPRAGKTGGISPTGARYRRWSKVGEWKYLETPFELARNAVRVALTAAVFKSQRKAFK